MDTNVVVVDDEIEYLNLVEEFSTLSHTKAVKFDTWSDKTKKTLRNNSLLFLDIHMPDTDGIDIIMELDKEQFLGGLVIMSGDDSGVKESVVKLVKSLSLNLIGVLSKPFRLSEFRHILKAFYLSQSFQKLQNLSSAAIELTHVEMLDLIDHDAIYPVYQPQINSQSGMLVGIECLSRMNHPDHGVIPPEIMIEALSNANLIDDYTLVLIERALTECGPLLKSSPKMTVSFNISALSLSKRFSEKLIALVESLNTDTSQITLEITETCAITLSSDALYSVSKFRAKGISLAIDDFGTGYSTIKLLNELPFNELKIDRSFVSHIDSETAKAIVNATAQLANSLNYRLIAEGVETEAQDQFLKDVGCYIVQGYYYSKPLLYSELALFIKNHS